MKTLVTIDFDIIMAPVINFYNNMVPGQSWDELYKTPQMACLHADFQHYQKLINYLIRVFDNIPLSSVHFIENHSQVLKYIMPLQQYNIINIDHHHDIYYEEKNKEKPNCGNWVYQIAQRNQLNSYTWYGNKNSNHMPEEQEQKYLTNFYVMDDIEYTDWPMKPDELVICLSEPWVPPHLRDLYFTIIDIANYKYNTHFDILYGEYST